MMRITPSANAQAASGYHRTSLRKQGEYYKQEIEAFWNGDLAKQIGLDEVTLENFDDLVNNINPITKKSLTPLNVDNRRVGWDMCVLPPKSFSVLSALTNDPELERVFKYANKEMMLEAERLILAQANTQFGRSFEQTGNACWSEFHHKIGRPVEHYRKNGEKVFAGQPLEHIHNFLISATYSKTRDKVLAIDPYLIFKSAPYLQSYFHSILSNGISKAGYTIERTQDAWEIVGVSRSVIERFSERSNIIDQIAEEKNITDPKEKSKLAALSRVSKSKSVPEHELLDVWKNQLTKEEFDALQNIKGQPQEESKPISAKEAIDRSLLHFLQRNSVAEEKRVLGHALQLGYGSLLPEDVATELNSRDNILRAEDNHIPILTTREMVKAEDQMIELATSGKGKFKPLNPDHKIKRDFLNEDQIRAVKSVLNTKNQVVAIEGKAGSGKSTLLQELSDGLRGAGKNMIPIAPSSQAVEVLRKEGFEEAQTIASFLINPELQQSIHDNVLCVDEASLIGVKTKSELLRIAKSQNSRVLLSGNIRQHNSPEFGDALRILQQQAKIETIHIKQNMRQKPEDYKKAVNLISERRTLEGYQILDQKMKAVQEIPHHENRLKKISEDYLSSLKAKRSALIVSPTHAEGNQITQIVREKLKFDGRIQGEERTFDTLKDLRLSESQKKDLISYKKENQVVRFIKNQKASDNKSGFKAGSHYEVLPIEKKDEVKVRDVKTKQVLTLPHETPKYYSVYQKTKTKIAKGDLIRPTVNLKSKEQTKINNGTPQVVKGFVGDDIKLENGKTLSTDSYHFKHGYVDTSFSSQGKTAQDVYVSMNPSYGGVNEQAFYVAVSRGRSRIQLYTSNKQELKTAISRSGERTSAREVAKEHERRLLEQKQRSHYQSINKQKEKYDSRQRQKEATRDISNRTENNR